jgi:hypothetical protein
MVDYLMKHTSALFFLMALPICESFRSIVHFSAYILPSSPCPVNEIHDRLEGYGLHFLWSWLLPYGASGSYFVRMRRQVSRPF